MNDNQNQYQFPNSSLISSCDQGASHGDYHMPQQQEPNGLLSTGGSSSVPQEIHDLLSIGGSSNHHLLHQTTDNMWMPSKMRWIRKMLISKQRGIRTLPTIQDEVQLDQASNNDNNSTSGVIRVCSNCNTTKTPLWRGGPQGPKSLCNACGIRQMKARRAMRANVGNTIPFKKRFKNINTSFSPSTSTVTSNNNNNKTMKKEKHVRLLEEVTKRKLTFPQEERDAAILLMALSSGLIHG